MRKGLCHIHSEGMEKQYDQAGPLARWLWRMGIRRFDAVVTVNRHLQSFAIDSLKLSREKVYMIPAFLPPTRNAISKLQLPKDIADFVRSHSPCLCATGCFGGTYKGYHTYGFELLLGLVKRLGPLFPGVGLVLAINYVRDPEHKQMFREELRASGLEDNVLIVEELGENYLELVRRSDIFLRPTYTEGDALSVRESLHFGVATVASDCAPRPDGCVLFKTGDVEDLTMKVIECLGIKVADKLHENDQFHCGKFLIEFYQRMRANCG